MVKKPYKEEINDIYIRRKFNSSSSEDELEWHRDRRDREVHIVESGGWKFQEDNKLPVDLNDGDVIFIKANSFHRVIKGHGSFIIDIKEL